MAAGTADMTGEGKDSQPNRPSRGTRKTLASQTGGAAGRRFFLAKPGSSGVPELGTEFSAEAEAMVESLKTGLSYFVVSEWRAIADFSGRKPQLGREAVSGRLKAGA